VEIALAALLGVVIGVAVGALGGGGAVLALPLLVYLLDQPVHAATTASLLVVAAAGAAGGAGQARAGLVCWDCVAALTVAAALGSIAGTALNTAVGGDAILLAFVPVLLLAAGAIWRSGRHPGGDDEHCPRVQVAPAVLAGLVVGVLIGFFGVGGGFLVVPMMVFALGFPLRRAVATSIVVVALVSAVALVVHLIGGGEIDLPLAVAMAAGAVAGALAGSALGPALPRATLARGFATLVTAVAAWLLISVTLLGGPPAA